MCLIAGGLQKGDVAPKLKTMIEAGRHRGPDSFGAWVDGQVIYSRDFKRVREIPHGNVGLVHCRLAITGSHPQPLIGEFPLVHNGEVYNHPQLRSWLELKGFRFYTDVDSEVMLHLLEYSLGKRPIVDAVRFVMKAVDGDYAVAFVSSGRVYLFRDPVGVRPLYYSEGGYFASERKVLWAIGEEAHAVGPGELVVLGSGVNVMKFRVLSLPELAGRVPFTKARAMESVSRSLDYAVRVRSTPKVGVTFSGGLDSSLVAHIASRYSNVVLYVSGLEGSHDVIAAERASEELGLPLRKALFTCEDVKRAVRDVMFAIEEPDAMNLSIGIPAYFATRMAREDGVHVLLSGQGADELFGGYFKYLRGDWSLMLHDIVGIGDRNLARDDKIGMLNGVESRFPFLDLGVVTAALRTPPDLKVRGSEGKVILRNVAARLGLSSRIVSARKKAVQYGSGSNKCLQLMARSKGLKLHELASHLFEEVFGDERLWNEGNAQKLYIKRASSFRL